MAWIDALGWTLLILVLLAFVYPRARKYVRRHVHWGHKSTAHSHPRPADKPAK